MILLVLVALTSSHGRFCAHDEVLQSIPKELLKMPKITKSVDLKTEARKPIRIYFDTSYLSLNSGDIKMCKTVGTTIKWGGTEKVCLDGDILTEAKKNSIIETLENVKLYFNSTLRVSPTSSFDLKSTIDPPSGSTMGDSSYYPNKVKKITEYDLYLTVYARPHGQDSSTIASAASIVFDPDNGGRPIQGFIHLNLDKIPASPSNLNSENRSFFETALHETIHALGFSKSLYNNWIDRQTGQPYGGKLPKTVCFNASYSDKKFTILHTPRLHEIITERFGNEYFFKDCPSGAELEDAGGDGTQGSHFDMLPYYTELMSGITIGYSHISDITLSLLYDTGWYDVNYSNAEPLIWGDYRAYVGRTTPFYNFATAPPQTVFPSSYLYQGEQDTCTFDHSAGGKFNVDNHECRGTNIGNEECKLVEFFDVTKTGKYDKDSVTMSYFPVAGPYSNMMCKIPQTVSAGFSGYHMSFGRNSFCAKARLNSVLFAKTMSSEDSNSNNHYHNLSKAKNMASVNNLANFGCYQMSCTEDNELTIFVEDVGRRCTSKGSSLYFDEVTITCPDPKIICGIKNYKTNNEDGPKSTTMIVRNDCNNVNYTNCQEPSRVSSFDFSNLRPSIVSLLIIIEVDTPSLGLDNIFDFRTINRKMDIEIVGSGDYSTITLDNSKFGSMLGRFSLSNFKSITFKNEGTPMKCDVFALSDIVNIYNQDGSAGRLIDITGVGFIEFSKFQYYNHFKINSNSGISIVIKDAKEITVDPHGKVVIIRSGSSENFELSEAFGDFIVFTSEKEIRLNTTGNRTIIIGTLAESSVITIDDQDTLNNPNLLFGIRVQNLVTLNFPRYDIPIKISGTGRLTIKTGQTSDTIIVSEKVVASGSLELSLPSVVDHFNTSYISVLGNKTIFTISKNINDTLAQLLDESVDRVHVNIDILNIGTFTDAILDNNYYIAQMVKIDEGGTAVVSNINFETGTNISIIYPKVPTYKPALTHLSTSLSSVPSKIVIDKGVMKGQLPNPLRLLNMTDYQYKFVEFEDVSGVFKKSYVDGFLGAKKIVPKEPSPFEKGRIYAIVTVVCVVVIFAIVMGCMAYRKKRKTAVNNEVRAEP